MSVFSEFGVGTCRGVFWGWEAGFALWAVEHASDVPRFPVVDTSAMVIESDAGIAPSGAGELFIEACGEHGPFSAVGMADDADASWVDVGTICEEVSAVGGDCGEEGEGLPSLNVGFGLPRVTAWRTDGERHESVLGELVCEIAIWFGAKTD